MLQWVTHPWTCIRLKASLLMKHVVIDYICFSCVVISLSNHGLVAAGTCFWQQQDEWEGDRNVHNRTMTCWLHGQREKETRKAPWGDCCVETVAWLWIHRKDWQSFFFNIKKLNETVDDYFLCWNKKEKSYPSQKPYYTFSEGISLWGIVSWGDVRTK